MSHHEGSIKKRLCNPPAEQIALHGDYEVAGLFMGAGKAIEEQDTHNKHLDSFRDQMIVIEQNYVSDRKKLAEKYATRCHEVFDRLLKGIGYEGPSGY